MEKIDISESQILYMEILLRLTISGLNIKYVDKVLRSAVLMRLRCDCLLSAVRAVHRLLDF